MTGPVLASMFLPLSHFLIASTRLRTILVSRLGEKPYSLAYSLLTLVAFIWLIIAYRHAPALPLWHVPRWVQLALAPLIFVSSVLVVAGLTTPNPVIVRSEQLFDRPEIVRGVLRITRNPFFWGVGLFAITHLIMIGDLRASLSFGSVAFLGLAGAPILDAKKARRHGSSWQIFAAATSNVPFLAIAQGRQRLAWDEFGLGRFAFAIVLFMAALLFHRPLFGDNPLGGF